uniref:Uncharacterized protein n=1 Tax=Ditylenchus dipsaci TaxID=166011 RepID=A0A915ERE1_9BILA
MSRLPNILTKLQARISMLDKAYLTQQTQPAKDFLRVTEQSAQLWLKELNKIAFVTVQLSRNFQLLILSIANLFQPRGADSLNTPASAILNRSGPRGANSFNTPASAILNRSDPRGANYLDDPDFDVLNRADPNGANSLNTPASAILNRADNGRRSHSSTSGGTSHTTRQVETAAERNRRRSLTLSHGRKSLVVIGRSITPGSLSAEEESEGQEA